MVKKVPSTQKPEGRVSPVAASDKSRPVEIPLEKLRFDSTQPRQAFHHPDGRVSDDAAKAVQELAESIKSNGLIHPITVESVGDGTYRVIVGERRTRAHILLGKASILARVRGDLAKPKKRLVYQLAENVNREDLTDAEMSRSILELMKGGDDEPAMLQSEIAAYLGKSEGWVSRYVRFADTELQRLWVDTGIADSVENLYRLSILPVTAQADIRRRVQLPENDPEFIAKPIARAVIDEFARAAKIAKASASQSPAPVRPPAPVHSPVAPAAEGGKGGEASSNESDPVSAQLEQMAWEGREPPVSTTPASAPPMNPVTSGYQLPSGDRAQILARAGVVLQEGEGGPAQPPINVRGPMVSLQRLMDRLDPADREALALVQLSVSLPGPLAGRIANALAGVMVDEKEVPAVVQNELAKLQ